MGKKKKKSKEIPHEKPISLKPLTPEEALKALLSTPAPEHKKGKKSKK